MKNGLVIDKDGNKVWYRNGNLHRTDGPATEYASGSKAWWVDGKRHRTDGPAVEYADGSKQWWVNDECLGFNDRGFWALWDLLTDKQCNNLDLLMHLPSVARP